MPLAKSAASQPDHVRVTFRIPAEGGARSADIVGEFTGWGLVAMAREDDGGYAADFELKTGSAYRFRYLVDGERWENDWAADNYVPNAYGGDDSIVDLRSSGSTPGGQFEARRSRAAIRSVPAASPGTAAVSRNQTTGRVDRWSVAG